MVLRFDGLNVASPGLRAQVGVVDLLAQAMLILTRPVAVRYRALKPPEKLIDGVEGSDAARPGLCAAAHAGVLLSTLAHEAALVVIMAAAIFAHR